MHLTCVLLWSALVTASSLDVFSRTRQRRSFLHAFTESAAKTGTDPFCSEGYSNGAACCPAACGQCGGSGCASRPGGSAQCCTSGVTAADTICATPQDTLCWIPQDEGVCTDLVGSYTCTNAASASSASQKNLAACHQVCKETAGCVGGQFLVKNSNKGVCSLFGVEGADATQGTECASAVEETTSESYVFSCEQSSWISFSFKVTGVKHDAFIADSTIKENFETNLRAGIIAEAQELTDSKLIQLSYATDASGNLVVRVTLRSTQVANHEVMRTAMGKPDSLQVRLASAVAATSNIATVADGTFEVTDITMPAIDAGTEETPSIDLSSIVARFGSLQQQIDTLSTELVEVEEAVDSVSTEANASSTAVHDSLAAMNHTVQAAARNKELAGQLNTQAENVTNMVAKAMEEVHRVQGVLNKMEGSAMEMEEQTTNLTARLDGLKLKASLLLPGGKGGLLERLDADEAVLAQHWKDVKDTDTVDANITANLRANFWRAKDIVQNVTEELQANLSERVVSTV